MSVIPKTTPTPFVTNLQNMKFHYDKPRRFMHIFKFINIIFTITIWSIKVVLTVINSNIFYLNKIDVHLKGGHHDLLKMCITIFFWKDWIKPRNIHISLANIWNGFLQNKQITICAGYNMKVILVLLTRLAAVLVQKLISFWCSPNLWIMCRSCFAQWWSTENI